MVDMTTRSSGTMPPAPERAAGDLADVDAKPLGRQSAEERAARGKAARASTPLEAHAEFRRADDVEPALQGHDPPSMHLFSHKTASDLWDGPDRVTVESHLLDDNDHARA